MSTAIIDSRHTEFSKNINYVILFVYKDNTVAGNIPVRKGEGMAILDIIVLEDVLREINGPQKTIKH